MTADFPLSDKPPAEIGEMPTRKEMADIVQEIVKDATGDDFTISSVDFDLAERYARYLDVIYERFASLEQEVSRLRETELTDEECEGIICVADTPFGSMAMAPVAFYSACIKLRRRISGSTE